MDEDYYWGNATEYVRPPRGRCGKVCYEKKTAQTKKNMLEHRGLEWGLRIYACPQCNAWHISRLNKYRK
jgi:hypothetical protein